MQEKRVLFVCMGNICRSPAGEGVLQHVLRRRGIKDIAVDSAGTIAYHAGEPPDARMIDAAQRRGYTLTGQARRFERRDFDSFELILAMDQSNRADLLALANTGQAQKVRLLSEFLDGEWPEDVPDPYYGGSEGFEQVLDMIEAACDPIIEHLLRSQHGQ